MLIGRKANLRHPHSEVTHFFLFRCMLTTAEDVYSKCQGMNWMIVESSFDSRRRNEMFCLLHSAQIGALDPTQRPIRWVREALSLGLKRPGR